MSLFPEENLHAFFREQYETLDEIIDEVTENL